MTENKRFIPIFDGIDKRVVGAKDNGEIISFMDMFDLLNEQEETINNLKKALWESEMSYIEEKNEYSTDVEIDIDWLKKEFEREYWNSDVE